MMPVALLEDLELILTTAASTGRSVVAVFTSSSCKICQQAAPAWLALVEEFATTQLQFVDIDIDKGPEVAMAMEVSAVPTFKVFQNGQEVGAMRGANLGAVRQLCERQVSGQAHLPSAADSTARKQARAVARQQENRQQSVGRKHAQKLAIGEMLADASNRERARTALATLLKLVSNVIESPAELKFRTIRAENKAIKEKLLGCAGARELLLAAGFEYRRRPLGEAALLEPLPSHTHPQEEELYVLPDGNLTELIEFQSGLSTILSHL